MEHPPGNAHSTVNLDDLVEELAAYAEEPSDWVPGEVEAKGALAVTMAIRELSEVLWRTRPL